MLEPAVPFSVLVAGLKGAAERFEEVQRPSDDAFRALFEVLAWVGVLRERFRLDGKPIPAYLNGLYYARNVVLHQGVAVLEWVGGAYGEGAYGEGPYGGAAEPSWPLSSEMLAPRWDTGLRDYDDLIAGHEARLVLRNLLSGIS